MVSRSWSFALLALAAAACTSDGVGPGGGSTLVDPPQNLRYTVTSGGPETTPVATLLEWDPQSNPNLAAYNVYSRTSTSASWKLRGTTTSFSFHDTGVPELQYYVAALDIDGFESDGSNIVTVDERLTLPRPNGLTTTSLDGAIALTWPDNAFQTDPQGFLTYRIYSTSYDLDLDRCGTTWSLEGSTIAPEFVAGALTNGVPRCFGVSAVSIEGFESLWSPIRDDTPRPDARNVVLFARQADPALSGFRFWKDLNGDGRAQASELGLVGPGAAADADFSVERDASGALFLTPVRSGASVTGYGTGVIADLTSIDVAPASGYSRVPIEALPGHGYVFQMSGDGGGFLRYGALRVTHVGRDLLIMDWSYQTDPGNPQLLVAGR